MAAFVEKRRSRQRAQPRSCCRRVASSAERDRAAKDAHDASDELPGGHGCKLVFRPDRRVRRQDTDPNHDA
jgi:hypothetical protein